MRTVYRIYRVGKLERIGESGDPTTETTDPGYWKLQIHGTGNHGFKVLFTAILVLCAFNL